MRVIYDHQIFSTQEYGGISRYFYELALGVNQFPNIEAMILGGLYINHYLSHAQKDLKIIGRLIAKIPKTGRIIRLANFLFTKLMLFYLRPDVVHQTYYSRFGRAPKSSKVVLTVFDMIHELRGDGFSRKDHTSRDKLIAVKRANHVICISESTRNDLIRLFQIDPNKISVIHLGFNLNKANMQRAPIISNSPYILYVGSRIGYKNFVSLLKSFANLRAENRQLQLVCFGGGVFSQKELLLANQLGLMPTDMVHISGEDSKLANLYTHAKVFVYPSLYEGFGIPPLEAMSCGCPVACSNISSIPEIVGHAGVYFDPESVSSMTDTIRSLLDNTSLRASMINSGYERIKQYSWIQCAKETLAIYERILQED